MPSRSSVFTIPTSPNCSSEIDMTDISSHLRLRAIEDASQNPVRFGADGQAVSLTEGYIPLLVNFTDEDRAAKGLRVFADGAPPPAPRYFSALEMVRDYEMLLLLGERGAGKTTFARHIAKQLADGKSLPRLVFRNEQGDEEYEALGELDLLPLLVTAEPGLTATELLHRYVPGLDGLLNSSIWQTGKTELLLILDQIERLGEMGPLLIEQLRNLQASTTGLRILMLGDAHIVRDWELAPELVRYELLPLLPRQRQSLVNDDKLNSLSANPALLSVLLEADVDQQFETEEALADHWVAKVSANLKLEPDLFPRLALKLLTGSDEDEESVALTRLKVLGRRLWIPLASRALADTPAEAVRLFEQAPQASEQLIRSIARRLLAHGDKIETLLSPLLAGAEDMPLHGALLAADFLEQAPALRERVTSLLFTIVDEGRLSPYRRERAARHLSRLGDPRDLEALVQVPGGSFTFGSTTHPNSAPAHTVQVSTFRIGRYPVVNASYARFVEETGRLWRSPDAQDPERRNAPATDLTWRDAMAYCVWLTKLWRNEGRIDPSEAVRLPTEPEWERAARGDMPDAGDEVIVYPWGTEFHLDRANSEEAGFNRTVAVGLFPKGASPYGCLDMAGQVWEWTTTLWGDDMTKPSFAYPYASDGREDADAGPKIRRVLRGGCFSSNRLKACTTYRGSLEPDGFWRGNGFRIVVA